jgi:hypothetical protein
MSLIATKFVSRLLINHQKQWRVNMCLELWQKVNKDPTFTCISRIIRGDESWIYTYDPETKQQLLQWKSPRAKKAQQVRSSTKSMLIVFFNLKEIVHREFFPPNTMVNSDFYCDILRQVRENEWWKRPDGVTRTGSFVTTTCPPTRPWKPQNLWLTTTWLSFPILPIRQT